MHYFAYGSNLDPVQMRGRCPGSAPLGRAVLRGHRLVFPRPCASWGGGVAGIEVDGGAVVEGVVYHVTDADLASLDRYEGVADGEYERRRVIVHQPDGKSFEVWTYYANADPAGPTPPSRRYLEAILRGARHYGLPAGYVAQLAGVRTVEG
ncbi:MAG: gamma-glutamylcyclotransferase family protein [Phycisphaeraceae bacterium]